MPQEALAIALNRADSLDFWEQSLLEMQGKMNQFTTIWDELWILVSTCTL